jgi:hypothetical protein
MEEKDRFLIPKDKTQGRPYFLISNFSHVLNVECFLPGNSPAGNYPEESIKQDHISLLVLDPESQKEVDKTEYQVTPHPRAYKQNQMTYQTRVYKDTTQTKSALSWSRKFIGERNIRVHQFTSGIIKHLIK